MDAFVAHAAQAYAYDYFGVLLALAVLEWILPRRPAGEGLGARWLGNAGLAILDSVILKLLLPVSGIVWSVVCAERGWGLFNRLNLPGWMVIPVSLAALDLTAYVQHYLLHRVPLLWRIHRTHHADPEVDFTTGFRFHPLEAIYTTLARYCAIAALGLPPVGVLGAELVITIWAFLDHANLRVPRRLDRLLRLVVVTPEVHRTHHSRDGRDNRMNFGAVSTLWDRLFGTFRDAPAAGPNGVVMGVEGFEARRYVRLRWMLVQPFLPGEAPRLPLETHRFVEGSRIDAAANLRV